MATVTRENIGLLTDKLTVTLNKEDYFSGFEQSLKKYAKTANIPGFRKGMVPAGLVKKMYGQSVFTDEVLRTVEKELNTYLSNEQLDIFAQPLPLDNDARALDMNNPADVSFAFEIGLKPNFEIDTKKIKVTRYVIDVTDEMIDQEVERLQIRNGKMTEPEAVAGDENVLNVKFIECDENGNEIEGGISKDNSLLVKYFEASFRKNFIGKKNNDTVVLQLDKAFEDKEKEAILADLGLTPADGNRYFKLLITKVGLVEKAEMNAEFFAAVYPNNEITTAEDFRAEVKKEIENYYAQQARNQIHDQIYHHLVDHTNMDFPESFLKRWLQTGGEKQKTAEEAEQEYPTFINQLKWTLVSSKLAADNKIEVHPDDIREFAKQQLFSYMGGQLGALGDNQQWVDDYANRMMQDRKYVEESYHRISTEKLFGLLESQVTAKEESISAEAFAEKLHHHHH
ncbi:MAG: trigger factor [Sediminibacterium sp. Gen4]|jgi:trigger factor|uniref:trigger factor n=1 Tax=unclassified Sediminibacterium TaxID=2635961 RepID=UPI0015C0DE04|nr:MULTISPECIES: trigger factor [unclassified Sediminibacterium]MBW0161420.1 trigger factor [Sediminibacterium sp.]MBW0164010.1 trigger factor [Sediminibacterium sp.]NWK66085.1 trigger factor [Sediminibacterium sp. Gen4]